ncbi:MAG: hypothetical protein WC451_06105 [Patescibacteria group bacterium]|jgi:hypothetical protein
MAVVIDIKTGKAEPWAQLQTAAQSLLNCYDVAFEKEGHVYTADGRVYPSITQILSAEGFINTAFYDEWSRDRGSMVHLACHYDITGELDEDSLDDEIRPYLAAFRKFMAESGFKVDKSEVPAINKLYGYAGTPDLVGCFPKPTAARRFALELNKEGKYHLIPFTDQNDFNVWQAAVACYHWKTNNLKRR